jgi:hypothetical protein
MREFGGFAGEDRRESVDLEGKTPLLLRLDSNESPLESPKDTELCVFPPVIPP